MACTPKIEPPQVDGNDIIFRGHCDGKCEGGGDCGAVFELTQDGKKNKGSRVTASGSGIGPAFMRVTAEKDIDNGEVVLRCKCEGKNSGEATYSFSLEHRTTIEDIVEIVVTLGLKKLL